MATNYFRPKIARPTTQMDILLETTTLKMMGTNPGLVLVLHGVVVVVVVFVLVVVLILILALATV